MWHQVKAVIKGKNHELSGLEACARQACRSIHVHDATCCTTAAPYAYSLVAPRHARCQCSDIFQMLISRACPMQQNCCGLWRVSHTYKYTHPAVRPLLAHTICTVPSSFKLKRGCWSQWTPLGAVCGHGPAIDQASLSGSAASSSQLSSRPTQAASDSIVTVMHNATQGCTLSACTCSCCSRQHQAGRVSGTSCAHVDCSCMHQWHMTI